MYSQRRFVRGVNRARTDRRCRKGNRMPFYKSGKPRRIGFTTDLFTTWSSGIQPHCSPSIYEINRWVMSMVRSYP